MFSFFKKAGGPSHEHAGHAAENGHGGGCCGGQGPEQRDVDQEQHEESSVPFASHEEPGTSAAIGDAALARNHQQEGRS